MRQTFALLTAAIILLLAAKPTAAAPKVPAVGDQLSLSLTNKYGDVLANPTVAQILGDGLVLQSGAVAMKIKYEDLPPSVRQKYQPLAAGVVKKEEKQGAATAAFVTYTQQLQAEQAKHLAAQEQQENKLASERINTHSPDVPKFLSISIPGQNWKLIIPDLGFGNWTKQEDTNQFIVRNQPAPGGFDIALFVEEPANDLAGNDPVFDYYWSNMANGSLIDARSAKGEKKDKFIKVSYAAQGQTNVNYFFAYHGKWVDVHLWKASVEPGDEKLFAEFDNGLSYGE